MTMYEIVLSTGARYFTKSRVAGVRAPFQMLEMTVAKGPLFAGEELNKARAQLEAGETKEARFAVAHIVAEIAH